MLSLDFGWFSLTVLKVMDFTDKEICMIRMIFDFISFLAGFDKDQWVLKRQWGWKAIVRMEKVILAYPSILDENKSMYLITNRTVGIQLYTLIHCDQIFFWVN